MLIRTRALTFGVALAATLATTFASADPVVAADPSSATGAPLTREQVRQELKTALRDGTAPVAIASDLYPVAPSVAAPAAVAKSRDQVKQELAAALRDGSLQAQRANDYNPVPVAANAAPTKSRSEVRHELADFKAAPGHAAAWRYVGGANGWVLEG